MINYSPSKITLSLKPRIEVSETKYKIESFIGFRYDFSFNDKNWIWECEKRQENKEELLSECEKLLKVYSDEAKMFSKSEAQKSKKHTI